MFSENLKKCRENNNKNQKDISSYIGVDRSTYAKWETGDRIPDILTLKKIANYFTVSTDYLLDNEKSDSPIYKETAKIQKAFSKVDESTRKRMLDMLELAFPQAFDEYEWALNVLKEQNVQAFSMLNEGTTELSKNDIINMAKSIKGEK